MKIVAMITRLFLGLVFFVFGLNLYFRFFSTGPAHSGVAGQFFSAMAASHYMYVVGVFQVVPGILLLINRYVPLALALLAPVIFNIVVVHVLLVPSGLPTAAVLTLLWILTAIPVRSAFFPLLQPRVGPDHSHYN